jgi:hypothetical protein
MPFQKGNKINLGKKNRLGKTGYKHTQETKDKIRNIINEKYSLGTVMGYQKGHKRCGGVLFKKGQMPWNTGKDLGGNKSSYPSIFHRKSFRIGIRKRDNYQCQNCGITEEEHIIVFGIALSIHHIDYDKTNCCEENLITVCHACNMRANHFRSYWRTHYSEFLKLLTPKEREEFIRIGNRYADVKELKYR